MNKGLLADWRANFLTGLAIVLPAVISIAVFFWVFGTVANFTDKLLFLVPKAWKYANPATKEFHWYWSLLSLVLAVGLIVAIGRMARHYAGKKLIQMVDTVLLRIPLLNKIYGAVKQVNEAFTSSNKSSFKQVVLVQFPRPGIYSVGFITGMDHHEVQVKTKEKVVSVFVPTTPNPTTGFLVLVPEKDLTKLEMSVADGIKFIISLGAVAPDYVPNLPPLSPLTTLPPVPPIPPVPPVEPADQPR